jgi:RimJ/RimL family protein N-acetyltransferase
LIEVGTMRLITPRLWLDALREEDAPALFAYRADPAVARYQGWRPQQLGEVQAFIAEQASVAWATPRSWCQRAVRLHNGTLIGDIGVHFIDDPADTVELGISIAPAQQGHGYAREALHGVLSELFAQLGTHRVCASVDPRNRACVALLRSLGLRAEAHLRESLRQEDGWADDLIFALLRREWPPAGRRVAEGERAAVGQ